MQSNAEIKKKASSSLKSKKNKILFILVAVYLYVPLVFIFIRPAMWAFYAAMLTFYWPFSKMVYNAARGKNLDWEELIDFSYFKEFLQTRIFILVRILPFLLISIVAFVWMSLVRTNPEWYPFAHEEQEKFIITIACIAVVTIFSIITFIVGSKFSTLKYYVMDGTSANDAITQFKSDMVDNYKEHFFFLLPYFLLAGLSSILLLVPLIYFIPLIMFMEIGWYYDGAFETSIQDTFYNDLTDCLSAQEKELNSKLEQQQLQQSNMRQYMNSRGIGNVSTVDGFNSLENTHKGNGQRPAWPPRPQQPYNNQGYGNQYSQNPQYPNQGYNNQYPPTNMPQQPYNNQGYKPYNQPNGQPPYRR